MHLQKKLLKKLLFLSLIIIYLTQIGLAGEQIVLKPVSGHSNQEQINEALKQAATQAEGISIFLTAGVYSIDNTITIQSSVKLTGDSNAIVSVYSGSSQWFTGTNSIIYSNSNDNIEISGFQIDGNCNELPFEYHHSRSDTAHDCERAILIMGQTSKFCNNIVIHDMQIYDCFSDGIHIRFANNVHCYSNFISNCQHEGIFWTCVVNGLAEANKIAGITSDCMRCDNCVTFMVKNNYFYSYTGNNNSQAPKGWQNGIQVADAGASKGYDASNKPLSTKDGEITGNTFANTGEKAVWLDSTGKGYDNVYIHDNTFINVNVFTNAGHSVTVDITAINASVPTYQNTTGVIVPTKETSELIFSSIFDILNLNYTTTAKTEYTSRDFDYNIQETERGKIAVKFKIVGWNNLSKVNNISYVSSPDDIVIESTVIKNPSLQDWYGGISQINKTISVKVENGTANATMNVSVKWYNYEKDSKTGAKQKGKMHTSNYTFNDSGPAPNIWSEPETIRGIVYQYPTYFMLSVPESQNITSVKYENETDYAEHIFLVGYTNITSNGTKYTEFESLNHWEGNLTHQGNWICSTGEYSPKNLTVTVNTPYNTMNVTNMEVIKKELPATIISFWFYPTILFFGSLYITFKFFWNRLPFH